VIVIGCYVHCSCHSLGQVAFTNLFLSFKTTVSRIFEGALQGGDWSVVAPCIAANGKDQPYHQMSLSISHYLRLDITTRLSPVAHSREKNVSIASAPHSLNHHQVSQLEESQTLFPSYKSVAHHQTVNNPQQRCPQHHWSCKNKNHREKLAKKQPCTNK